MACVATETGLSLYLSPLPYSAAVGFNAPEEQSNSLDVAILATLYCEHQRY